MKLRLRDGSVALVDADVYVIVRRHKWYFNRHHGQSGGYVATSVNGAIRYLHQFVLPNAPQHIDHVNGDARDCRRANLRLATSQENARNARKIRRKCTSKYKGVYFDGYRRGRLLKKPWSARITIAYRGRLIGRFATQREAAMAYDAEARRHFGEFGRFNFPKRGERSALHVDGA